MTDINKIANGYRFLYSIVLISFEVAGEKMIKDKYKQLCLFFKFGGIRIMNIHKCYESL